MLCLLDRLPSRFFSIIALLVGAGLACHAHAQESALVGSSNVAVKLTLSVGSTVDAISTATIALDGRKLDSGMHVSYGVAAQYTLPLLKYFALGGALGYLSWRGGGGSLDGPRNWLLDLSVFPEGRLKLAERLMLYVAIPLGLSLNVLNEVEDVTENGLENVASNPALGFHISSLIGARFHIASWIGVFTELGYIFRSFSHELPVRVDSRIGAPHVERRGVTVAFGQFTLNLGMCAFF